jgi:hypothetical protein
MYKYELKCRLNGAKLLNGVRGFQDRHGSEVNVRKAGAAPGSFIVYLQRTDLLKYGKKNLLRLPW